MIRAFTHTFAADVKAGDTIIFDTPRWDVPIERISVAQCDGWVGLHGNKEQFSLYLKPTDTIRVLNSESTS